jgi:hypothetical protein
MRIAPELEVQAIKTNLTSYAEELEAQASGLEKPAALGVLRVPSVGQQQQ